MSLRPSPTKLSPEMTPEIEKILEIVKK